MSYDKLHRQPPPRAATPESPYMALQIVAASYGCFNYRPTHSSASEQLAALNGVACGTHHSVRVARRVRGGTRSGCLPPTDLRSDHRRHRRILQGSGVFEGVGVLPQVSEAGRSPIEVNAEQPREAPLPMEESVGGRSPTEVNAEQPRPRKAPLPMQESGCRQIIHRG